VDHPFEQQQVARQLTNLGMEPGRGIPSGFIPPPLRASSIRLRDRTIIYCDGATGWIVDLSSGEASGESSACQQEVAP
jgi:hypothetical protein